MSDLLLDLANWCEQEAGPARNLDGEIWAAIQGVELLIFENPPSSGEVLSYRGALNYPDMPAVARFTASIDAAIGLIPEGWFFSGLDQKSPAVRIWTEGNRASYSPGLDGLHAVSPALAICAAALRARASAAVSTQTERGA